MLRSLYVSAIYMVFIVLGLSAPFIFSLGYVWVDTFDPQAVAPQLLEQIPLSLIMAVAAIGSYFALDRRKGRVPALTWMLLAFAIWVTLSTALWAEVPSAAWVKWNPAFKTICFAAFLPLVFRSRIQIEALVQIYVFSIAVHFLPGGVKTLVSGGGYGLALGVISGNSLLAEGATLSAVALMLVPVILFLRQYTLLIPRGWLANIGYIGLVVAAIAAAIGTYERTALIGLVVMGAGLWWFARRKLLFGIAAILAVLVVGSVTSDAWTSRISTIKQYNTEGSALSRILVWRWTLNYVAQHPLGGGFNSYIVDRIVLPPDNPNDPPVVREGVAFHSVYFEMLGEQGYPGLALFLTMILFGFFQLRRAARQAKANPDLSWARALAQALQVSLATLMVCGSFIGIAFQPMIYFLLAVSACLKSHVSRVVERQHVGDLNLHAIALSEENAAGSLVIQS